MSDYWRQKKVDKFKKAAELLKSSKHIVAFTGAGISVESGIPPFRGRNGLWSKYNPVFLDLDYFNRNPADSWRLIRKIFYDFIGKAKPNPAHFILGEWEKIGFLKAVITQNIDNLHQEGGSKNVLEFHGTSKKLTCVKCGEKYKVTDIDLNELPPLCKQCGGLLKPDFVFFGEPIPENVLTLSINESKICDLMIVIGTSGQIMPASQIPYIAKENGAKILEINIKKSTFTYSITDIFLKGKASELLRKINDLL